MTLAFNLYPPYWGTGIKVKSISDDYRMVAVEMPLKRHNRNLMGTHFGGSLFSMTDPFYMVMLAQILGKEYIVWDQSSNIRFRKPGKGNVSAQFELSKHFTDDVIAKTDCGEKYCPEFHINILDGKDNIVAEVTKTIYIRRRILKNSVPKKVIPIPLCM